MFLRRLSHEKEIGVGRWARNGHASLGAAIFLLTFSTFYFSWVPRSAAHRAFWFDEIFTILVSSRSSAHDIWNALLGGMEIHPPLDFLFRHFALLLPGSRELVLRLPSILSLYFTVIALFLYGLRSHSLAGGLFAATFFALTPAMAFSLEARAYGPLLLVSAVFLLVWQAIVRRNSSSFWRWVAAGACVGLASWIHYYGVLLFLPLLVGTTVVWRTNRKFPTQALASFGAALVLNLAVLPFVMRARQYSPLFWAKPPALYMAAGVTLRTYGDAIVLFVALALIACVRWFRGGPSVYARALARSSMTPSETAVLVTFAMLPIAQWFLARFVTNAFDTRYTIPNLLGGSILLGILAARLFAGTAFRTELLALLCAVLACAGVFFGESELRKTSDRDFGVIDGLWPNGAYGEFELSTVRDQVNGIEQLIAETRNPVLSPHPQSYLVQFYYGSPNLRRHLILATDQQTTLRTMGFDTEYRALINLARFVPLNLANYGDLIKGRPEILLAHGKYVRNSWILQKLNQDHYLAILPSTTDSRFYAWDCVPSEAIPSAKSFGLRYGAAVAHKTR